MSLKKYFKNRGVAFVVIGLFSVLAILLVFISLQGGIGRYIKTSVGDSYEDGPTYGHGRNLPYNPGETPVGQPIPNVSDKWDSQRLAEVCGQTKAKLDLAIAENQKLLDRSQGIHDDIAKVTKQLQDMGSRVTMGGPAGATVSQPPQGSNSSEQYDTLIDEWFRLKGQLYENINDLRNVQAGLVAGTKTINELRDKLTSLGCGKSA